jgi:hypothetical protein
MLPADEDHFDHLLRERIPCRAWECSKPGPVGLHPRHLHSSLTGALDCGGVEAVLHLPFSPNQWPTPAETDIVVQPDRPPVEANVQFLRARLRSDHSGPHFEAGRLAVAWFPNSVGEAVHETLSEQTRLVWSALIASTRPARVEVAGGRRVPGLRIGAQAEAHVRAANVPLALHGSARVELR